MFPQVWNALVSCHYETLSARLDGYQRYTVLDQSYPAIVKSQLPASVDGILYFDVTQTDLNILDEFEGEIYQRVLATVETVDSVSIETFIYRIKDNFRYKLSDREWDPDKFFSQDLTEFLKWL